ncbi:MAG: S41 family peptidase [Rikenellaceae bacterium]
MRQARLIILMCAVITTAHIAFGAKPSTGANEKSAQLSKLNQFFGLLMNNYVEDVEPAPLVESAIRATLKELDPHSVYYTAEEMKSINETMDGEFSGVGIEFDVINDTLRVVNTIAGAPAERVGVMANDRIVRVDSLYIIGVNHSEVPKLLRGEAGSRVDIEVVRSGENSTLNFSIERGKIPINTVDAAYKLNPKSGYIKVNRFGETTMREFSEAYKSFGRIDNLVVDLRGNGGGYLHQAVEMANFFLPKGSLVVTTEGDGVATQELRCKSRGEFEKGRVIVIIDEASASASEIVAGAIQDWDRGVVVGQTSFGKGLVQRQYPMADGSTVRLTIARYHTPSGRVIQRPYTKGEKDEYYERKRTDVDSLTAPRYKTLRRGREVYGEGGIIPDIKVVGDTTRFSDEYSQLIRAGIVNKYTIAYLDKERGELLAKYKTEGEYKSKFEVTEDMIVQLLDMAKESGSNIEKVDVKALRSESELYIKALISRRLYSSSSFFEIMNSRDTMTFGRIEKLLGNWDAEIKDIWGE